VDDFDADSYKSKLAAVLDAETDKVTLVVAAASVKVTADILVADASVAMAALRALVCEDVGACSAASKALGVMVEAVDEPMYVWPPSPSSPSPPPPLPFMPPSADTSDNLGDKQVTKGKISKEVTIAIAVGAAALLGCVCAMACLWKKRKQSPAVGDGGKASTDLGVALHTGSFRELPGARALATVPFCDGADLRMPPPENSLPGSPVYSAQKWLATRVAEDAKEMRSDSYSFVCGDHRSVRL
jgi:hypothetical protein